jgi:glutamine synthetase
VKYQNILIENVRGLKEIFEEKYDGVSKEQISLIEEISNHIEAINAKVTKMIDDRKKANTMSDLEKKALNYCFKVKPMFDEIRYHCDKLELLVDDEIWPLTKYREMLFTR